MRKINKIFLLFAILFLCSCFSVSEINYSESIDNEKAIGKNRLMVQLYDTDIYNDRISIKTDNNTFVFQGSKTNKSINTKSSGNSKVLEFKLNQNVKYIIIKSNSKRYKLSINEKYSILFLEIRDDKLDALYTNREPIYTD